MSWQTDCGNKGGEYYGSEVNGSPVGQWSGSKKVNAKSIMGMMSLGLDNGETLTVVADGSDESAAVAHIERFLSGQDA